MASREERKAKLEAMSETDLATFADRVGANWHFDAKLGHQFWRDENIKCLLDQADGAKGDEVDRGLHLPTEYERRRHREERSVRANWVSAMAAMLALLISIAAVTKGELWNFPRRSDPIPAEGQATP